MIAATFTAPADYRSYQIKGQVISVAPAGPDGEARASLYVDAMLKVMTGLGVSREQLSHTFPLAGLVCVRYRPEAVFVQTPGPKAGSAVTDSET
ncbi:hypothetical protein ABI_10220 [Asticcacaulis biprosthecium C19]|uniref:Uncharacterized protein n=1 Tax=Asticcacaulis biprosthecium C19 TaxID=715226 RepID=F4QH48_9CAUL|nr:hypothetical protein [Asticcacaulis biprosthecium]EGF92585.1 hypothetical protein ABI_10220 [Asticcacaulis biprosthecium C19]